MDATGSPPPSDGPGSHEDAHLGRALLDAAVASVLAALHQPVEPPDPRSLPAEAHDERGAFVTIHVGGELNGCIGTLRGEEPLATSVARLARQAAFGDPRLPPLRVDQLDAAELEVSVLSPLEPIDATSRRAVLAQVRPGLHGLLIARPRHQAVFLPDVWSQLPEPDRFLDHLLRKAGLHPGTWPDRMAASRFTTRRWSRPLTA